MELNGAQIRRDIVVVGASAGGFEPTFRVLHSIAGEPPVIIGVVIHRSPFGGPSFLAEVLARRAGRAVVEPIDAVDVTAGLIYLAPRDMHLMFAGGRAGAVRSAKQHFTRPAVDPLFISAAETYGPRVVGVLLSGAGADGVLGLIHIKTNGGISLVQSPDEAAHPRMPETALREDHVDAALPVSELMKVIPALTRGKKVETNGHALTTSGSLFAAPSSRAPHRA